MESFEEDIETVLETSDYAIEMPPKQREMIQSLYAMLEDFDVYGYGANDAEIIEDPLFAKCREYTKLVYEELSGDDLDAWEKQRTNGETPLVIFIR
jgi:hypothetical protein